MAHRQWQDPNSLANKNKNEAYVNYQKKYEQMTKQQQLIEQKKLEIQKRLEDKKKKETEEALKKLNEDKYKSESSRSKRSYGYSKNKHWSGKDRQEDVSPATLPANIFSNDGSFLEQFQKISGIKVEPRKRSLQNYSVKASETKNGDVRNEESGPSIQSVISGENKEPEKEERRKERRWSSPDRSHSPEKAYQQQKSQQEIQQQVMQQQQMMQQVIQHQQVIHQQVMQQQQNIQHQTIQLPPLQQQVFTPQQIPPALSMNYQPRFTPMQCGMMLPPPMTPSSIPPPAPLNPGSIPSPSPLQPCSIPSPSPLQPCSIPSPSPLQPYAIPPPSPLIPHSIPPPSPMVLNSIPPPSPLAPHSIPPPLPLRPQSIPPPLQRPPMFLSMVPPPPPPPPPEEKKLPIESVKSSSPSKFETGTDDLKIGPPTIEDSLKGLFRDDDYSSSEEDEQVIGPSDVKQLQSDSDSEPEQKSTESNSDKCSYGKSDHKLDSLSDLESDLGQESQPVPERESESESYAPLVIEDTQTQFPSDTRDSSNAGDAALPDLSSEGDSLPRPEREADPIDNRVEECYFKQEEIKEEPQDDYNKDMQVKDLVYFEEENLDTTYLNGKEGVEVKDEEIESEIKLEVKQEYMIDTSTLETSVKSEEPPVKKKRRSRWADSADLPQVEASVTSPSIRPPVAPNIRPSMPPIRPPGVGPVGMVAPTVLGVVNPIVPPLPSSVPTVNVPGMSGSMISKVTRTDTALVAYAMKAFGHTNLTDAEWKKAEDHYKINLLYQDMMKKKEELQRLQAAGKNKYEYDSDEETEGGTWEHKLRSAEMEATQLWADELTEQAKGKHHIGDFLPPDELARFMEKYEALKEGREPDLSDYKEFKLKEDNIGFQMLQKLGWTEGQGLGPDGTGIMDPVNKAVMRPENQGLGVDRPDDVEADDDEYDAYRKRMMLAYRFRPNPMNNPRRPYY